MQFFKNFIKMKFFNRFLCNGSSFLCIVILKLVLLHMLLYFKLDKLSSAHAFALSIQWLSFLCIGLALSTCAHALALWWILFCACAYIRTSYFYACACTCKGASTSVREREQGMRDWGECERMPKSCLFSVRHTSERASIPLVTRWLYEWLYVHITMIMNLFFFKVRTPDR